jgi:hypothetical protein
MQATQILEGRGEKSVKRLLGLFCAMLLITLAGGCHNDATTAGQESEATVEMASETSGDTLAKVTGDVGQGSEEADPAAGQIGEAGQEPAGE